MFVQGEWAIWQRGQGVGNNYGHQDAKMPRGVWRAASIGPGNLPSPDAAALRQPTKPRGLIHIEVTGLAVSDAFDFR